MKKLTAIKFWGFIKTTDHRPIEQRPTEPPTTYHVPTDPPTTYQPTHRLSLIKIVKIEDHILNLFCTLLSKSRKIILNVVGFMAI